jgi:O-antigen/teichoic acid export membrane protein
VKWLGWAFGRRWQADLGPEDGPRAGLFQSSPLGQALGTYLPATVAFRLINFGRIWLLTWWMTTQQFGLLSIILLSINVLIPLCSLGLNEAVTRYVPQHETRQSLAEFVRRSFGLLITVVLVGVGLMIIFSGALGDLLYARAFAEPATGEQFGAEAAALARLSALVIGLCAVYFYLLAVLKGLRMFAALAAVEVTHGVIFLLASVAAILTGHLSAFTLTMMYGGSLVIPVVFFGVGLRRVIARWTSPSKVSAGEGLAGKLLRFSIWTTLAGVSWQLLVAYPTLFLNKVHGPEAAAVFEAVRRIGQFILIGAVAVSTVVLSTVVKTWESQGREAARRQLSLAMRGTGLGLLVLCAAVALARNLIVEIYPDGYGTGGAVLPLQLLFFLIGAFLTFLSIHFHLIEKTRSIFWPWAAGVAANVIIAFWLAGPNLEMVRQHPLWQRLAPATAAIFATGFSDPQGLDGAAWCGVMAIAVALIVCLALLLVERCRLDRGSYVVMISAILLAAKPWILAAGMVALLLFAWRSDLVFTSQERDSLIGHLRGAWGRLPVLGRLWHPKDDGP